MKQNKSSDEHENDKSFVVLVVAVLSIATTKVLLTVMLHVVGIMLWEKDGVWEGSILSEGAREIL
jgi:hypothetical protein